MQKRGLPAPSVRRAFDRNRVNLPGQVETIWQPFYDSATVPAAGASAIRFFQNPIGQAGKTLSDTNMEGAGSLPKGQAFQVTGIEVLLVPAGTPSAFTWSDDIAAFYNGGALDFVIGSKSFTKQAPLLRFPPSVGQQGYAAATTATNDVDYSRAIGREYAIADLLLESSQNFHVELRDIGAISADAVVFVTLNGYLFRNAQ